MKFLSALLFFAAAAFAQQPVEDVITAQDTTVYRLSEIDIRPELVGGIYTLPMFISEHIALPELSNKKLKLFVSFIVETDGSMSDVNFLHLLAEDLYDIPSAETPDPIEEAEQLELINEEVVRVLKLFDGTWSPAIRNDAPVRCLYIYPININLE